MKEITLPLASIKPYPNNPRDNRNAIEPVKESIRRYGYNTPIIVDTDYVVISGHTRLLALQQLGYTEAKVIVSTMTKEQANEFRIIDNKSSEVARWDRDKLIAELRNIEGDMSSFFEKDDLKKLIGDLDQVSAKTPDAKEIRNAEKEVHGHFQKLSEEMAERVVHVHCQHCGEKFGFDLI